MRYFLEFVVKVDFVFVVLIIIPLVWFKLNGKNDDHDRQYFRIDRKSTRLNSSHMA